MCVPCVQECNPHLEYGSSGSFDRGSSRCLIPVTRTLLYCFLSAWPAVPLARLPSGPAKRHTCTHTHTHTHTHKHTHSIVRTRFFMLWPVSFTYNCTFEINITQRRGDKLTPTSTFSTSCSLFFGSDIRSQNLFFLIALFENYIFIYREHKWTLHTMLCGRADWKTYTNLDLKVICGVKWCRYSSSHRQI